MDYYKIWVLLNVIKPISHKTQHEMFGKALWMIKSGVVHVVKMYFPKT
jgi:hypothetical protein